MSGRAEFRSRAARERGMAILTAMLVIALGTITMVAIASSQRLSLQRERNEAALSLARDLAVSGERFAAALLFRDRKAGERENSDSLDDDWAQTIPPIPIDELAVIQGCVVDMQGRFNLNNLVDAEGNASAPHVAQLVRLLQGLGIAAEKAQAVLDWVDADVNATVPDGAEDDFYTGLDPAYRAANAPFAAVSELKLVKGFWSSVEAEREDYELLLPHVAALPKRADGRPTAVNVNTATPEVLASLGPEVAPLAADLSRWDTLAYEDYPECEDLFDLESEGPETLTEERDTTPYESVLLFDQEVDTADTGNAISDVAYDVRSDYFQVRIDIVAEAARLTQYTLFERDGEGRSRVLYRSRRTP